MSVRGAVEYVHLVEAGPDEVEWLVTPCRSGCPTRDHESWGDCLRDAQIQIDRHGLQHSAVEKDKDARLSRYEDARRQGLQPRNTTWKSIRSAFEHGGEPAGG